MDDDLRYLLVHGVKQGSIGIPDPTNSVDKVYATSVESYEVIFG